MVSSMSPSPVALPPLAAEDVAVVVALAEAADPVVVQLLPQAVDRRPTK
jgi:hypothetical protein